MTLTLKQLKVAEEYIKLERRLSERDQKIIEMYNSCRNLPRW